MILKDGSEAAEYSYQEKSRKVPEKITKSFFPTKLKERLAYSDKVNRLILHKSVKTRKCVLQEGSQVKIFITIEAFSPKCIGQLMIKPILKSNMQIQNLIKNNARADKKAGQGKKIKKELKPKGKSRYLDKISRNADDVIQPHSSLASVR